MNLDIDITLSPGAQAPSYATDGSGAFDFHIHEILQTRGCLGATTHGLIADLGVRMEVPPGHVMLLFSRSGHGLLSGIRLSNCVGVIDSDYRGQIYVGVQQDQPNGWVSSVEDGPFRVFPLIRDLSKFKPGDRICQGFILPVPRVTFNIVDQLSPTSRGENGLGSTGT